MSARESSLEMAAQIEEAVASVSAPMGGRLSPDEMIRGLVAQGVPREKAERIAQGGMRDKPVSPPVVKPSRGMNKTEARRAAELEALHRAGAIRSWAYESITLKLADGCRFTPDFMVVDALGGITLEDTKRGFVRDDALVKLKVAAKLFPCFRIVMLMGRRAKDGGGWDLREFSA